MASEQGPAIRTRDAAQYERVKLALASVKVQPGEDAPTLKVFAPTLIDAGLDAIERGAGSVPESAPGAVDVEVHYRAEIEALRSQLANGNSALARANEEIERLKLDHADTLARTDLGHAHPDDMIARALAGVTANARKGSKSRGALEALHAIKAHVDAPTLVDAIAAAAMHYESRLDTLAAQKAKRGGSASSAEEGA